MFPSKATFHPWDSMKAFFGYSLDVNTLFVREDPATIAAHAMHEVRSHSNTRGYVTDSTDTNSYLHTYACTTIDQATRMDTCVVSRKKEMLFGHVNTIGGFKIATF